MYKNKNINEFSKKRLNTIKLNNDGFKIAEEDLKLRGFGEISGTKQSGYQLFKILDPLKDIKIMDSRWSFWLIPSIQEIKKYNQLINLYSKKYSFSLL